MSAIETIKHAGKTIRIFHEERPDSPREAFDNATIMECWHTRYNLGDKQIERCSEEEMKEKYAEMGDPILAILPLNLYEHSGLSVSTGSFACSWDSGQVGWVFITQSKSDEMGFAGWTLDKLVEAIKGDVETYDHYVSGRVYYFTIKGRDGDDLQSVGGFYGHMDGVIEDAKEAAEGCEDPADARAAAEMEQRVTFASVV